jgi:hypothetical protein
MERSTMRSWLIWTSLLSVLLALAWWDRSGIVLLLLLLVLTWRVGIFF